MPKTAEYGLPRVGSVCHRRTVSKKAKQIRDMLKMHRFDHYWCLPSQIENASFAWMITFNDFIVDARTLPRDVQEIACQKGLIPYVYADKC